MWIAIIVNKHGRYDRSFNDVIESVQLHKTEHDAISAFGAAYNTREADANGIAFELWNRKRDGDFGRNTNGWITHEIQKIRMQKNKKFHKELFGILYLKEVNLRF